jgi:hypothetical protein
MYVYVKKDYKEKPEMRVQVLPQTQLAYLKSYLNA